MWFWLSAVFLASDVVGSRSAETCDRADVYSAMAGPFAEYRRALLENDVISLGRGQVVTDTVWIGTVLSSLTGLRPSKGRKDWRRSAEVRIAVTIHCRADARLTIGLPESLDWIRVGKVILETPTPALIQSIVQKVHPSRKEDWCRRYPWACPATNPEPTLEQVQPSTHSRSKTAPGEGPKSKREP